MGLIKVTQISRNGQPVGSLDTLIDVKDIASPLVENGSGNTIIEVVESEEVVSTSVQAKTVQYIVQEDLATVIGLSSDIFLGTVKKRDDRDPIAGAGVLGFVLGRILGTATSVGGDSEFLYTEGGVLTAVKYLIDEDIQTISDATAQASSLLIKRVAWVAPEAEGGSDVTGEIEDESKPFATPDIAMNALATAGYNERERTVKFYPSRTYSLPGISQAGNYEANYCTINNSIGQEVITMTGPKTYLNIYGVGLVIDDVNGFGGIILAPTVDAEFFLDCENINAVVNKSISLEPISKLTVNIQVRGNSTSFNSGITLDGNVQGTINVPGGITSQGSPALDMNSFSGDVDLYTKKLENTVSGGTIKSTSGAGGTIRIHDTEIIYPNTGGTDVVQNNGIFMEFHKCRANNVANTTLGQFINLTASSLTGVKLLDCNFVTAAAQMVQVGVTGNNGRFYSDRNTYCRTENTNGISFVTISDFEGEINGTWVNNSATLPTVLIAYPVGPLTAQFGECLLIAKGIVANSMQSIGVRSINVSDLISNNKASDANSIIAATKEYTSAGLTDQRF